MGIFLVQSVTGVEPALPGFGMNFNTADRPPYRLSYAPTGGGGNLSEFANGMIDGWAPLVSGK